MSLDVEKMFPSLEAGKVAEIVEEEYLRASLEEEVNNVEMGLILAIMEDREDLEKWGLVEVTCRRKKKGKKVQITTTWITGETGERQRTCFMTQKRRLPWRRGGR